MRKASKTRPHSRPKSRTKSASDGAKGSRAQAAAKALGARRRAAGASAVRAKTAGRKVAADRKSAAARKGAAARKAGGARSRTRGTASVARAAPAGARLRAARRKFRLEPLEVRRKRALAILDGLRRLYPDARCELDHGTALDLLVATILSAQCTDRRVNMTTPALFARYRTAVAYAGANQAEVEALIKPTGFYRNKTKSILALGKALAERHSGEVPETMEELVTLPGVGRKTANVIIAEWFKRPGIAVDTHVIRLTGPIWRLTDQTDPVKIEFALYELIPEEDRAFFGIATIHHGRRLCTARRTLCEACPLVPVCPSAFLYSVSTPPATA